MMVRETVIFDLDQVVTTTGEHGPPARLPNTTMQRTRLL